MTQLHDQINFPILARIARRVAIGAAKTLAAVAILLSVQSVAPASSLFVSYTSSSGGGIDVFSLTPQTPGTQYDSENAGVSSLTVANNTAYWVTNSLQIYSDTLNDQTGGTGKTALNSVPFAGVTITDLAVDPVSGSYFVGWNAPGYGWFVADYPSTTDPAYSIFVNGADPIRGLTVDGNKAYWIEGTRLLSQNLDGTGKSVFQSFDSTVTLFDLGIDSADQAYFLSAYAPGLSPLLIRYPLTTNASGNLVSISNTNIAALTLAGDRLYWIDGSSIWSENVNGTGLTLQQTLPSGFTPTDLAVSLDTVTTAAVPEPATSAMVGGVLIALAFFTRRYQARRR